MDIQKYFLFITAAVMAAIPLPLLKAYTKTGRRYYLVFSGICYWILVMTYITILKKYEMSAVYPLLKIFSILIVVATGLIIFQEELTGTKIIGIILGLVAIWLLTENSYTSLHPLE
jgi:multidrug transporter EmrE-like cation transporter